MAMVISVKGSSKSTSTFDVPPEAIKIEGNPSRYFDHDSDSIQSMVTSYEERGQDTPIMCRRGPDKGLILVYGKRRLEAAIAYNEIHKDKPMTIRTEVVADNEKAAFDRAVDENLIREDTSVVDNAFAQKVYREKYKMENKEIAKRFRTSQATVSRMMKITGLREHILKMIHEGDLTFDTAVQLADLPDAEQDEILAKVKAEQEEWDVRLNKMIEEAGERRESVSTAPEVNGVQPSDGEEPTKKPKRNNAQPGGADKPARKPTVNEAAKRAIREKQTAAAEKAATNGAPPAKKKGPGRKSDKVCDPPTFVQLKQAITEDVLLIQKCPEPLLAIMTETLRFMKGEITQTQWAKEIKAVTRRYKVKSPDEE